jgi:xanthine dehydrogenase iron-sulfur cluster and FAD-binding subunit A
MMMMKKKVVAPVERVVFALNGERQEVAAADVDPSTTLLEFIRTRTPFKGPKLGCGEGTVPCITSTVVLPPVLLYVVTTYLCLVACASLCAIN